MNTRLVLALSFLVVALAACGGVPKNRSDGYVPAQMECVTPTDPQCVGAATVGVRAEVPTSADDVKAIFGQCEVIVEGETEPRPCTDIELVVRATRENEERAAVVEGYNFRFDDLNQPTYRLFAESETLDLNAAPMELTPGSNVRIRLEGRPKPSTGTDPSAIKNAKPAAKKKTTKRPKSKPKAAQKPRENP